MVQVREIVTGSVLVVLLAIAAGTSWSTTRASASVAAPSATPLVEAVASGPGFAVCTADTTWRRPTADEQRAHLAGDHRFDGVWEAPDSAGAREFAAPAVLYDGKSADGMSWIMHLTGLWNVWSSPATRPRTCWTEQPQLFLFGYEAIAYDAQDRGTAVLRVRPASGYREIVLIGPVRAQIAVVADHMLDHVAVPAALVTPLH